MIGSDREVDRAWDRISREPFVLESFVKEMHVRECRLTHSIIITKAVK